VRIVEMVAARASRRGSRDRLDYIDAMRPDDARQLTRRSRHIGGWFRPEAAALFALVDEVQRSIGAEGGLFEIGAHHGKSAVMLCAMARPSESVGVCDLFGEQGLNASASGSGDRERLERNVALVTPGFDRLRVFECPSAELAPADVGAGQRFFHVDGGHLVEEALGDLRLAADVLHDQGTVVVDDPFRPDWPGVTEAILRFLDQRSEYVPLVMGFNKLVLVRRDARPRYQQALDASELVWSYFDRHVYGTRTRHIAGEPVTVFSIPSYRQLSRLDPTIARVRRLASAARRRLAVR
jgi:Methyltransferase domain